MNENGRRGKTNDDGLTQTNDRESGPQVQEPHALPDKTDETKDTTDEMRDMTDETRKGNESNELHDHKVVSKNKKFLTSRCPTGI
jgi:hypothetical protein